MSYPITPNATHPHTDELAIAAAFCPAGVAFLTQNDDSYVIDFGSQESFNAFIVAVSESFCDETVKAAILAKYQN